MTYRRGINVGDALQLIKNWGDLPKPSAVITSPPYLDKYDYGNKSRIGTRGQKVSEYAELMMQLFRDLAQVATDNATMWLVVGRVRRNKRLVALPDILTDSAQNVGWTLREAITWDKQKAMPWTQEGRLREITEQVLLFSKREEFRFDPSELRSPIPNSIWWRRYPERYSPTGTMPTNLWSISIPTQGSWGRIRKHFCPFPEELTYRMLSLTTTKGDTVLDPFAGIGSVPAMAQAMGRCGYGIELTSEFAEHYQQALTDAHSFLSRVDHDQEQRQRFERTIVELRLLKFAKLLGRFLAASGIAVAWVRIIDSARPFDRETKVCAADFELVIADDSCIQNVRSAAKVIASRKPLARFGIDACFTPVHLRNTATNGPWYELGRYWHPPKPGAPKLPGPHVVTHLNPDVDAVDDTPYV